VSAAAPPRLTPGAAGLLYALGAFGIWGVSPLFFRALAHVPATEIVAHRVAWSLLLLCALVTLKRGWSEVRGALGPLRNRWLFLLTTLLISGNWLLFIWAVTHARVLQASLGYFINPLLSVLLGVVFLGERLRRPQVIAVLLAAAGVLNLVVSHGVFPWISLCLASTFALYGLLRKQVPVESLSGLLIETALLLPLALVYLVLLAGRGASSFGADAPSTSALLIGGGVVTAVPLLWFVNAARRLRLSTLGLMQYLAPTGQFLLAVLAFGEPFTPAHAVTFGLIWASLVLYSVDAYLRQRRAPSVPAG
jgi:chloramphenicol-sensitive protein RarD